MKLSIKYSVVSVFFVFLLSCKKSDNKSEKAVTGSIENTSENVDDNLRNSIESFNFEGFSKYLNKEDNKTYVINFWATWCKPCVAELPFFEEINKNYKEKNVEVILVSLDFPKKIEKSLIPFLEKNKIKSKVVLLDDPKQNDWIPKIDNEWSGAIPATLIYNREQREFYEKSFTYDELEKQLNKFLN
ncbi:TlpA disulfide reductase family protein [Abyssalbus ytuae]|uniref:TlpA family protein disulfide reductase n=1 Tax=Abyssalbus ytuae TaxID=2926907 RepID=A0A9E6ZZQ2_9FLAO|nr:TlpA disulfide reductase family protein [Abyssalbus ytuae]UOB16851.1 TlpA family protein disulfide reductase [Abyssalbus ytuae]